MTCCSHVELWLGRMILDSAGNPVGRIEDIEAEGDRVTHILAGEQALLERLWGLQRLLRRHHRGYRIRWDQLHWSASGPLRTRAPREELEKLK